MQSILLKPSFCAAALNLSPHIQDEEASARAGYVTSPPPEPAHQRMPATEAASRPGEADAERHPEAEPPSAGSLQSDEGLASRSAAASQSQQKTAGAAGPALAGQGAQADVGGDLRAVEAAEPAAERVESKAFSKAGSASLIAIDANTQESVTAGLQGSVSSAAAAPEPAPPSQPIMPRPTVCVKSTLVL